MLINVTQCLGEMCIMYPVSGGFYTLAVRFLDPGFGMALGYNYLFQWMVTLPVELTAAGITVQYWTGDVPIAAWITSERRAALRLWSPSADPSLLSQSSGSSSSLSISLEPSVSQRRSSGHLCSSL